jgi:hypothetical protein
VLRGAVGVRPAPDDLRPATGPSFGEVEVRSR